MAGCGFDFYGGIKKPGGPYHLFYHLLRLSHLIRARRSRYVDCLVDMSLEFLEIKGPVVQCRRQAESVIDQRLLA